MRPAEMQQLGRLAGRATGATALIAKDVHRSIASRTFDALGVLGAPVRVLHDGISSAAYKGVHAALAAPAAAAAGLAARTSLATPVPLADSPRGGIALGVLNAAVGDALTRDYRELALELTVRRRGRPVDVDPAGVAEAFPRASSKLAVFIHGLAETEHAWELRPFAQARAERRSYGSRLREDLGYTPVYVRYNTGLHVSDNGRRLAEALEELVRAWPGAVDELALVGHSMGGLVARSASHYGAASGHAWIEPLRHVFCLGTPHLGAPLEKAANVAGWALGRTAVTRPFADLVNGRSAGIKDLRYGNCVEKDWCDCDPDEFIRDRCTEVPFVAHAAYYFIGATLSRDPGDPLATLAGDLLVRFPSASGRGAKRRIPFEIDNGAHVGGLHHFQLLNHPAVYEQVRKWLTRRHAAKTRLAAAS